MFELLTLMGVCGTMLIALEIDSRFKKKSNKKTQDKIRFIDNLPNEQYRREYSELGYSLVDIETEMVIAKVNTFEIITGYDGWYQPIREKRRVSPKIVLFKEKQFDKKF